MLCHDLSCGDRPVSSMDRYCYYCKRVASDNGIVIAASYWGKFKTTFQMLMIIALILDFQNRYFQMLATALTYIALILTVVSLIDYIAKNKQVLKEQK
mgnify:CR=1 FL=1